jgi:hypothetical protein
MRWRNCAQKIVTLSSWPPGTASGPSSLPSLSAARDPLRRYDSIEPGGDLPAISKLKTTRPWWVEESFDPPRRFREQGASSHG